MPRRTLQNRTIEVILLESDKHLGEKFELVRVKPIFAKNVLLPKGKAVIADENMKNKYKQKIESATKEREKKAEGYKDLFDKIADDNGITITGKTNKEGTLYAKIHDEEIAKIIKDEYSIEVPAHLFKLKNKISEVGTYTIPFAYKDISADFTLNVQPENPIDMKKEDESEKEAELEDEMTEELSEDTSKEK